MNALSRLGIFLAASTAGACAPIPSNREPAVPTPAPAERMDWWREARFGLFIHWGLYAVPAGEWQGNTSHGEWIRESAQIPLDEYEHF